MTNSVYDDIIYGNQSSYNEDLYTEQLCENMIILHKTMPTDCLSSRPPTSWEIQVITNKICEDYH